MQFIKRSEAVKAIKSGDQFTIEFITADLKRGTGGELILVENWQTVDAGDDDDNDDAAAGPGAGGKSKCPNHDEHKTINITNPVNKQVRKVHIDLIQTYNGKRILNG